jgi:hypothetical protein
MKLNQKQEKTTEIINTLIDSNIYTKKALTKELNMSFNTLQSRLINSNWTAVEMDFIIKNYK